MQQNKKSHYVCVSFIEKHNPMQPADKHCPVVYELQMGNANSFNTIDVTMVKKPVIPQSHQELAKSSVY